MKAKSQPVITIEQIITALENNPLADARTLLYQSKDARLNFSATALKVTKRGMLHLQVETGTQRQLEAFARFSDEEFERVKTAKIKKSSKIQIIGNFQMCGEKAVNLSDSRLLETDQYPAAQKRSSGKLKLAAATGETELVVNDEIHCAETSSN